MATATDATVSRGQLLSQIVEAILGGLGELSLFGFQVLSWTMRGPVRKTMAPAMFTVGVQSIPVVAITGMFIGMVLAVQSYEQFAAVGLATQLGRIINLSLVRELGPVLAAVMLAGRVGSAMAAELGTMRVSEQIDALACLGVNPIHYLAVPRFLACVLLIPLLTIMANFVGVMGGAIVCVYIYGVDSHFYWQNASGVVRLWDVFAGLIKPTFFGAAIGIIGCHRGFHSGAGAQGVGQAATRAFVLSFIVILGMDFFLGLVLNGMEAYLPGVTPSKGF